MTPIIPSFFVLAQKRIDAMPPIVIETEAVSHPNLGVVLAGLLAVIAIAFVVIILLKQRGQQAKYSNQRLFLELCQANHLSRRQRQLLRDISTEQQVQDPSLMLLDIELWKLDPTRSSKWHTPSIQSELLKLRSLLFTQGRQTPTLDLTNYR